MGYLNLYPLYIIKWREKEENKEKKTYLEYRCVDLVA